MVLFACVKPKLRVEKTNMCFIKIFSSSLFPKYYNDKG